MNIGNITNLQAPILQFNAILLKSVKNAVEILDLSVYIKNKRQKDIFTVFRYDAKSLFSVKS